MVTLHSLCNLWPPYYLISESDMSMLCSGRCVSGPGGSKKRRRGTATSNDTAGIHDTTQTWLFAYFLRAFHTSPEKRPLASSRPSIRVSACIITSPTRRKSIQKPTSLLLALIKIGQKCGQIYTRPIQIRHKSKRWSKRHWAPDDYLLTPWSRVLLEKLTSLCS
jgi:hypothetical protein